MKDNLTQIAIVLDKSGSMNTVKDATISSFNEFTEKQKSSGDDINLFFSQFDSETPHEVTFDGKIKDFQGLNSDNYKPTAMTPLHDAMGWVITELGNRLYVLPEEERPAKVVVVILTDGIENASREFTRERIADMIKHQTDVYKWLFVFLGANQDAVLTAKGFNIHAGAALSYNSNLASMRSSTGATNSIVNLWKYSNISFDPAEASFTDEDRKNAKQEDLQP